MTAPRSEPRAALSGTSKAKDFQAQNDYWEW